MFLTKGSSAHGATELALEKGLNTIIYMASVPQ